MQPFARVGAATQPPPSEHRPGARHLLRPVCQLTSWAGLAIKARQKALALWLDRLVRLISFFLLPVFLAQPSAPAGDGVCCARQSQGAAAEPAATACYRRAGTGAACSAQAAMGLSGGWGARLRYVGFFFLGKSAKQAGVCGSAHTRPFLCLGELGAGIPPPAPRLAPRCCRPQLSRRQQPCPQSVRFWKCVVHEI